MEALFRHILKSMFDEFVTGLDENVEFSRSTVNLKDLKVKEKKIHEIFQDFTGAPAEFAKGRINAMQLKLSLSGDIEITLSDVVLNLTLTPMKALKNAFMPDPAKQDGFVHRVPADLRSSAHWDSILSGSKTPADRSSGFPRYCQAHNKISKREKTEKVRETQCERCKVRLQTNFAACSLCTPCSYRESRCLLCGEDVFKDGEAAASKDGFAYAMSDIRNPEYFEKMLQGGPPPYQVPPRFCRHHLRPERRPTMTGQTRMTQCMMCKVRLQTNYEELSLCAPCSLQESGCMLCGAYLPPEEGRPSTGSSYPVWMRRRSKQMQTRSPMSSPKSMSPGSGSGPRMMATSGRANTPLMAKEEGEEGLDDLNYGEAVHPAQSDPLPGMLRRRSTDDFFRFHVKSPSQFGDSDWESEKNFVSTPPNELAGKEDKVEEEKPPEMDTAATHPDKSEDDDFQTPPEEPREEARKFPHGPKGAGASKERPRTHAFWRKKWSFAAGQESSDELVVPTPPGAELAPAPPSVPTIPEEDELVDESH